MIEFACNVSILESSQGSGSSITGILNENELGRNDLSDSQQQKDGNKSSETAGDVVFVEEKEDEKVRFVTPCKESESVAQDLQKK